MKLQRKAVQDGCAQYHSRDCGMVDMLVNARIGWGNLSMLQGV